MPQIQVSGVYYSYTMKLYASIYIFLNFFGKLSKLIFANKR